MITPVFTDPDATVAWSTNLSPSSAIDEKFDIGQTPGESARMVFTGSGGSVAIQLHEEDGQPPGA